MGSSNLALKPEALMMGTEKRTTACGIHARCQQGTCVSPPSVPVTLALSHLLTNGWAMGEQMLPEVPDAVNYDDCGEPIIPTKPQTSSCGTQMGPVASRVGTNWTLWLILNWKSKQNKRTLTWFSNSLLFICFIAFQMLSWLKDQETRCGGMDFVRIYIFFNLFSTVLYAHI